MKRLAWKYVAGLIDGEGCIDVQIVNSHWVTPRVRVCLTASSKDVIDLLQNNYGGQIYLRKTTNPSWFDSYSWELTGYSKVCMFLRNIVNHLIIKKEQARFLLWLEGNLKNKSIDSHPNLGQVREIVREELKLQKSDPHRLSEKAQARITPLL